MLSTTNTEVATTGKKAKFDVSSAMLHIIAMAAMLIDHSMKTVVECESIIFVIGRLAFPIFAFMAAQGFFYTHNYKKYILRMLIFALLSEVPYDLMKSQVPFDRYDQNVIWTFLLALLCIGVIDFVKQKCKKWMYIITAIVVSVIGVVLGMVFMVDYGGLGVLTVLTFYFLNKRTWWSRALQFVILFVINVFLLGGLGYIINVTAFGMELEIPQQGFAVLALIPIWLYRGRQGYHSKPFQYFCYAFYPVHMLILYFVTTLM